MSDLKYGMKWTTAEKQNPDSREIEKLKIKYSLLLKKMNQLFKINTGKERKNIRQKYYHKGFYQTVKEWTILSLQKLFHRI